MWTCDAGLWERALGAPVPVAFHEAGIGPASSCQGMQLVRSLWWLDQI